MFYRLARSRRLQSRRRNIASLEMRELQTLEELSFFTEHERLDWKGRFSIQVQLETVSMLVTGQHGDRHRGPISDT